jgi:Type IV secretion-system coupling protein DNA-binding domain
MKNEIHHSSVSTRSTRPDRSFVFEVIAPRSQDGAREVVGLETVMQSLVLSARHPIALEVAGTPTRKRFLVRATDAVSLSHAEHQLRLRYPQADIRHVSATDDPLQLLPHETVTVAELCPGAAAYLPMREWEPEILQQQKGIDPLLGVLAALSTVPEGHRAVAQIALVPASPTWSKPYQRKAVEHPLEPERIERQEQFANTRSTEGVPSTFGLIVLGLLFVALFVYFQFKQIIPAWIRETVVSLLLHGHLPALTGEERFQLFIGGGITLLLLIGTAIGIAHLKQYFWQPMYNQRLVAGRTGRPAYRGRIRLYILGLTDVTRRETHKAQKQTRRGALEALLAAYRQFHTADAGHFVPRILSERQGEQLLGLPTRHGSHGLPFLSLAKRLVRIGLIKEASFIKKMLMAPKFKKVAGIVRPLLTKVASCLLLTLRGFIRLLAFIVQHVSGKNTALPGWACGIERSNHFFTADFLGSAWRLPGLSDLGELTGIAQKRARSLPLPPALYPTQSGNAEPIGECSHGGVTHPFVIPPGFFNHHTFLGGKSGEGKSTLMVHLAKAVMQEGERGFFLLDPHGDLAQDVLRVVPESLHDKVVLIDLGDLDFCIGLNPLDVTLGRDRDLVVSALISVFSHIWKTSWGPRMEAPFRTAILTLLEANTTIVKRDRLHGPDQQYTLLDVVQVLVDESFCHDLLAMTEDLFIHRFWYEYYSPLNLVQQRDRIDPVLTKMMQFESKIARRILGQSHSTIRLDELVDARKMLIVRLAFSEAGAQTGSLIGATLLGLLMVTLREQSRKARDIRARMVLFLDEFQSFGAGADLSQLLAELRKYGGSAVLATQSLEYLSAIDPVLLPTVQANTKQYFLFRLSAPDAATIAEELDTAPADLVNLDSHTCYVRLVYARQQQPTFSLQLHLPALSSEEQLSLLQEQCQRTYCRRAADVERAVVTALGRAIAASMQRQHESEKSKMRAQTEEERKSDPSKEESEKGRQFARGKKRKKGLITSFDQYPYTGESMAQGSIPAGESEQEEVEE